MERKYNVGSFSLSLFCLGISLYSFYSHINNIWLIAPPNYIVLLLSIVAFTLGIKGFKDKTNWFSKLRSWVSVTLSLLLSISLFLACSLSILASSFGANEHIKTVHSPNDEYRIDFYHWDAGAAGTFGIRGELNGPLRFKKRIYFQKRTEDVEVEWKGNDTMSINNHILNLDKGDTYGY
ncbi:DUF5412 family protein [Halobacillus ihumii]|uniref:DUF5412 family protein n=1 Tax=Halobacillus ihumii TaxID=2686092 RepID=UPI0013D50EC3|nr:DUF5412 family protein [Halobacillus ihumii]